MLLLRIEPKSKLWSIQAQSVRSENCHKYCCQVGNMRIPPPAPRPEPIPKPKYGDSTFGQLVSGSIGNGIYIARLVWSMIALAPFVAGLDVWFEFRVILSMFAFLFALTLGPLGSLVLSFISYVGFTESWLWEWWQACLFCFPGVGFAAIGLNQIKSK